MITKGLQSISLVENSSGMCGVILLFLDVDPRGFYPPPLLLSFGNEILTASKIDPL
jgi:hypothetical protein